jgi:hypothetical protein
LFQDGAGSLYFFLADDRERGAGIDEGELLVL